MTGLKPVGHAEVFVTGLTNGVPPQTPGVVERIPHIPQKSSLARVGADVRTLQQ
jgi:hypothetical protein